MRDRQSPTLNISAIRVAGVGGLGLLALVVIMAVALPPARWLLAAGLGGGTLAAAALILSRRRRGVSGPRGDQPISLFDSASAVDEPAPKDARQHRERLREVPVGL